LSTMRSSRFIELGLYRIRGSAQAWRRGRSRAWSLQVNRVRDGTGSGSGNGLGGRSGFRSRCAFRGGHIVTGRQRRALDRRVGFTPERESERNHVRQDSDAHSHIAPKYRTWLLPEDATQHFGN
jgi:hypothetical protein